MDHRQGHSGVRAAVGDLYAVASGQYPLCVKVARRRHRDERLTRQARRSDVAAADERSQPSRFFLDGLAAEPGSLAHFFVSGLGRWGYRCMAFTWAASSSPSLNKSVLSVKLPSASTSTSST